MVKLKITPSRFAEACNVYEYLATLGGDVGTTVKILPRFVVNEAGEYIIGIVHDDDGDIKEYTNIEAAVKAVFSITPKRMEKLKKEFQEAARTIVNPTSDGA
jgi:hypothetical protein